MRKIQTFIIGTSFRYGEDNSSKNGKGEDGEISKEDGEREEEEEGEEEVRNGEEER